MTDILKGNVKVVNGNYRCLVCARLLILLGRKPGSS